jgi:uridylate kinase
MALEIGQLVGIGVQVGLVVGGGNLFRGAALQAAGLDRVTGDHMGMLATVMNALALRDALERSNIATQVMSSIPMSGVVDHYDRRKAIRALANGDVVIFCRRHRQPAVHDGLLGLPARYRGRGRRRAQGHQGRRRLLGRPDEGRPAVKYDRLTYDEVLDRKLEVMDLTAICLCRDHACRCGCSRWSAPARCSTSCAGATTAR